MKRGISGLFKSRDLWKSWTDPQDISHFLSICDVNANDRVRNTAGNHVQTSSGRLIFGGFNGANVCTWYSDHGISYQIGQLVSRGEISVAAVDSDNLFMTIRGGSF
jgi:hypothetical protein